MIKVLFITDSMKQRFGVTSVIMNILSNIDKKNIKIDVLAYDDSEEQMILRAQSYGADVFIMPRLSIHNIFHFRKYLYDFFENKKYDIVHSHFNQIDSIVFPVARSCGVKKCISHSHNTKLSENRLKAIRNRIMCWNIGLNADYWAACSEVAGCALFGKEFLCSEKAYIIHNGIECGRFKYNENSRYMIRNSLNIAEDVFVVGHVGSFKYQKNQMFLVEVFNKVLELAPNSILLFVGDGDEMQRVKEKCFELGIQKSVIFMGARSDIPDILSAFDVFVLPSLYEGLPVSGIEAQTNGLPCVFSSSITREVNLTDVEFLDLNQPFSVWANKIVDKIGKRNPGLYNTVIEKGYSVEDECKCLSDFYIKIIQKK